MKFFSKTKKNKKSISQKRKPNLNNEETQNDEWFDDRKNDLTMKEERSDDEEQRWRTKEETQNEEQSDDRKNDLTTKEERSDDDWTLGLA